MKKKNIIIWCLVAVLIVGVGISLLFLRDNGGSENIDDKPPIDERADVKVHIDEDDIVDYEADDEMTKVLKLEVSDNIQTNKNDNKGKEKLDESEVSKPIGVKK